MQQLTIMQQTESEILQTFFIPDEQYISLLREFNSLTFKKAKGVAYAKVRRELRIIERSMSAYDIIQNTKLAFTK